MKKNFNFESLVSKIDNLDSKNIRSLLLKLVKKKNFLENIFNKKKEGIVVVDLNLNIVYANDSAIDLIGLPDDFIEHKISKFLRSIEFGEKFSNKIKKWHTTSRKIININYPCERVIDFYMVPHEEGGELCYCNIK